MADLLDQTRTDIDKRLKELQPLHEEYLELEKAKAALDGLPARRRGPGRPPKSATPSADSGAAAPRRRRRRRGGTRAEQALAVVRKSPGITVAELSEQLDISQKNYLYRVMNDLQGQGAVRKEGRGYVAV